MGGPIPLCCLMLALPGTRASGPLKNPFIMKNSDHSFTCMCR